MHTNHSISTSSWRTAVLLLPLFIACSPASMAANVPADESVVHYELANSLAKAGHNEDAIVEYRTAYKLAPNGLVGRYCLQALEAYNRASTSGRIQQEAAELVSETNVETEREVKQTLRNANSQSNAIDIQKNNAVARVLATPSVRNVVVPVFPGFVSRPFNNGFGFGQTPFGIARVVDEAATSARIEDVRARAEAEKNAVIATAADRTDHLRSWSAERARLLNQTASNLQTQMDSSSGVQINPAGTNLYVRQYK